MLGTTFLPDRLRAGGGGGSTGGDSAGATWGDDGGVTKLSSQSVVRVGCGGVSGTSETVGAVGAVTGVGGAGTGGVRASGAVLPVTGGSDGCNSAVDGGEGPGSDGVTEENWRRNCLFLSVTLPLPSTLILYLL